jgi:xanthine/CO dehydrogenase XdhC/CoxF family maturation factor
MVMKEHRNHSFAFATVTSGKGSAYRQPGGKMLFSEVGQQYGAIHVPVV